MSGRYFEGHHPELKEALDNHFARVRKSFKTRGWRGVIVLGGGYGRGEGGVLQVDEGWALFNDLDYFLFDDEPENPALIEWCREIEQSESDLLRIDVEIKCLRSDGIKDVSTSIMFTDLVAGHVVIAGDGSFLIRLRDSLNYSKIGAEEAARLLWNRGSGMFFSVCRMGIDEEMEFVIRNHAKLKLALGDAWLCWNGQYSPKCRLRGERLEESTLPESLSNLKSWHAEGVDFKFNPFSGGMTWPELEEESRKLIAVWAIVFLVGEEIRLSRKLNDFGNYLTIARLFPGTSRVRNVVLAARDRIKRGGFIRTPLDYPRAGLMRALPCLLGLTSGGAGEAGNYLPDSPENPSQAIAWEGLYLKWWGYYA